MQAYALRAPASGRYFDGNAMRATLETARLYLDHEAARLDAALLSARRSIAAIVVAIDSIEEGAR